MPPASYARPASARPAPMRKKGKVAIHFREAIGRAVEDGADLADMTLRLTLSDFSELKRDNDVPLEDISFRNGEMRFLGVKVTGGGVEASRLDVGGDA
jgi:hypothetical protein